MKYELNFHFNRIFCSVHVQYGLTFHEVLMDYIVERLRFDSCARHSWHLNNQYWFFFVPDLLWQGFSFSIWGKDMSGKRWGWSNRYAAWVIASQPSTFHTLLQSTPKRHKHCNHFTIQWLPQNSMYAQVTWTSNSADSYSIPTEQKRLYRRTRDFHIEYHPFDTESVAVCFDH